MRLATLVARLPLVGEFTYKRGTEQVVRGKGTYGEKPKIGKLLENVMGLGRNCLIDNHVKMNYQL